MPTIYFDTSFYVHLREADESTAQRLVSDLNDLGAQLVLSRPLLLELLRSTASDGDQQRLHSRIHAFGRSSSAVTAAVSPSSLPQSSTGRLDVSSVEARSYRRMIISRRSSAAVCGSFRMPRSSTIRSGTAARSARRTLRVPSSVASAISSMSECASRRPAPRKLVHFSLARVAQILARRGPEMKRSRFTEEQRYAWEAWEAKRPLKASEFWLDVA